MSNLNEKYAITLNDDGTIKGVGYTHDGTVLPNWRECSEKAYKYWHLCKMVGGALVEPSDEDIANHEDIKQQKENYTKALQIGFYVQSPDYPELEGKYSVNAATHAKLNGIEAFITKYGAFPGGDGSSLAWPDMNNKKHIFTSIKVFERFAMLLNMYIAEVNLAEATNGSLPHPDGVI